MFEFGDIKFKPVEREDLKLLHQWENDSELIMFSRGKPLNFVSMAQLEKQYEDWMKDERELHFIVQLIDLKKPKDSRESIGIARLEHHDWGRVKTLAIGAYIGRKELWGKGLGKQIYLGLMEMAFNQLNAERCEAWSVEYNQRSHKALEACGFKKVGVMRQSTFVNGRKWDGYAFDILREEYMEQRTDLLRRMLGHKTEDYLKKHCNIKGR